MAAGTRLRDALSNPTSAWTLRRDTYFNGNGYLNRNSGNMFQAGLLVYGGDTPRSAYAAYDAIWGQHVLDPAPSGTLYNQAATFAATGTLAVSRQMVFGVVRPFAATGTLAVGKWIAKGVSFSATGTLTRQRLISVSKAFAATGSLAVTASKAFFVAANMAATGTLVAAKQLSMGVSRAFNAVGTLVTGQSFIPGAVGPAILAEYVRRFMTYLGRRW